MRFLILFLVIAPFTMSFNFFKSNRTDYCDIAREIRANVGKKLSKKHNINLVGVSGGMMGSVYMIGIMFQIRHPMDRDEARLLIVDCVEELINAINANIEIRPFLKDYPFTTKNANVAIYSCQPDGREVFDPAINTVSLYESDEIMYFTTEPNKIPYKHQYRESYQEALEFVKSHPQLQQQN